MPPTRLGQLRRWNLQVVQARHRMQRRGSQARFGGAEPLFLIAASVTGEAARRSFSLCWSGWLASAAGGFGPGGGGLAAGGCLAVGVIVAPWPC